MEIITIKFNASVIIYQKSEHKGFTNEDKALNIAYVDCGQNSYEPDLNAGIYSVNVLCMYSFEKSR